LIENGTYLRESRLLSSRPNSWPAAASAPNTFSRAVSVFSLGIRISPGRSAREQGSTHAVVRISRLFIIVMWTRKGNGVTDSNELGSKRRNCVNFDEKGTAAHRFGLLVGRGHG
jgi:hypothetical protein